MSALPTAHSPELDLLNTEVLAKYFTAREHEFYFRSLKSENDRRNFYPQLVGALTELLAFFDDTASLELLDSFIFRNRKKLKRVDQGLQILDHLKKANPRGVEILGLSPSVTFDSLRTAYRKAAKKHHPDVGGSNEDMKLVNVAFAEFHDVISQWREAPATQNTTDVPLDSIVEYLGFEIRSAAEYLNWLGVILVSVITDSWAVDSAYSTLLSLREHGLLSTSFAGQREFADYFAYRLIRLAERLHTAGLVNEAEADSFPERWRGASTTLRIALEEARDILAGDFELKVVITHPCQAENLYRLKVIDERRYREAQARFQKRGARNESIELDLARFQERGGFILLSYDVPFRCEPGTKSLVPVPGYFWGRIDHLSDEQRAEYFRAFGPSGSREALKQYLYTRTSSYLCSLIHTFSAEEAGEIERECEFLGKLSPERAEWFDVALRVSKYIRQLDPAARKEKLTLLQKLDTSEKPTIGIILIGAIDTHIRIAPTQNYLSVVMATPDRLRMKLQTGSTQTADEERKEKADWSHDVYLIRELDGNSIAGMATDTYWHHRNKPEMVVDALKPHIEQLLEAGNRMAPQNTGRLLGLGYWIDGISTALVKLKRWEEATYWLELFFSLCPHYQNRFAKGEKEKMLKRLARCKAQLARSHG